MANGVKELVIPYSPRKAFKGFHARSQRWACLVAHRRAGKTVACINDLIRRAFVDGKTDGRYAYIAPYHSQAKSIAWDYLLRYTADVRSKANASELWVELINGARIRLFGADNPDALRGMYLDGVILDEVADMRPRVWGEIIRPLLADREGWAVFIGTPKGHNFFYDIWKTANAVTSWFAASIKASTSGLINAEELADASRGMTDDQYAQEFECSFEAAVLGAYYAREFEAIEAEGRIRGVEYDSTMPVHTAWDIGYSDDTTCWFYQIVNGEIHVIDFYSANGHGVPHYVAMLRAKPYSYVKIGSKPMLLLPHDARAKTFAAAGKSVQQQFEDMGFTSRIAPELSTQDGIQAARLTLAKCFFDKENCNDGLEALKLYRREWDDDKKVFRDRPLHDWTSHAADAFRYLAVSWRDEVSKNTKPTPRFDVNLTVAEIIKRQTKKRLQDD